MRDSVFQRRRRPLRCYVKWCSHPHGVFDFVVQAKGSLGNSDTPRKTSPSILEDISAGQIPMCARSRSPRHSCEAAPCPQQFRSCPRAVDGNEQQHPPPGLVLGAVVYSLLPCVDLAFTSVVEPLCNGSFCGSQSFMAGRLLELMTKREAKIVITFLLLSWPLS